MRDIYNKELELLNQELTEMGELCSKAISLVSSAFESRDGSIAASAAVLDREIDRKERNIEALCIKLLLKQQPVAGDLRHISAALKMITDMERIGDQAEDIAEIIPYLGDRKAMGQEKISSMITAACGMVRDSVTAYVKQDTDLAHEVMERDDIVDGLFAEAKKELISLVAADPNNGEYALDLLMIAKYLERIGDHAVNIAEWAYYSVTGLHDRSVN